MDGVFCIADSIEMEGRKLAEGVQGPKLAMHKDFFFFLIWRSLTWVFAFYFGVFLFLLVGLSVVYGVLLTTVIPANKLKVLPMNSEFAVFFCLTELYRYYI